VHNLLLWLSGGGLKNDSGKFPSQHPDVKSSVEMEGGAVSVSNKRTPLLLPPSWPRAAMNNGDFICKGLFESQIHYFSIHVECPNNNREDRSGTSFEAKKRLYAANVHRCTPNTERGCVGATSLKGRGKQRKTRHALYMPVSLFSARRSI